MDTEENLLFTPAEFQIAKIQIVFFFKDDETQYKSVYFIITVIVLQLKQNLF